MIKPDGVQRGVIGESIHRFEKSDDIKLIALKMMVPDEKLVKEHYQEHFGRDYYDGLISYITCGPVVAMVFEGTDVVRKVRSLLGRSDPQDSAPCTIRGQFCISLKRTTVHASDSLESAEREIRLWFKENECF